MNIDNTQEQFNADLILGEITEKYILDNILKIKYPQAYKPEVAVKEYDLVVPEENFTVEVKTDIQYFDEDYGGVEKHNLFIEHIYRDEPSSLKVTTAKLWYHSNGKEIFEFDVSELREFYASGKYIDLVMTGENNGTTGMILPNKFGDFDMYICHRIPNDSEAYYDNLVELRKKLKQQQALVR